MMLTVETLWACSLRGIQEVAMPIHRWVVVVSLAFALRASYLCAQEPSFLCGGWDRAEERTGRLAKPVGGSEVVSDAVHALVIFAKFRDEDVSDEAPFWGQDLFDPELPVRSSWRAWCCRRGTRTLSRLWNRLLLNS